MKCSICGNEQNNVSYIAKEVRMGTNEPFEYFKCAKCGCLQIKEVPENIGDYYKNYYSLLFQIKEKESFLTRYFRFQMFRYYLFHKNAFAGNLISKFGDFFSWMKDGGFSFNSSILDVGCGNGRLLLKMGNSGFSKLQGSDPFIDNDLLYNCNSCQIKIRKSQLDELQETFDFIMLHHSFEHMDNPNKVFKDLLSLLNPFGKILIRIPIIDSYSWEKDGINCFQLADAPRHLFLHSKDSIHYLAASHGLKIDKIYYESNMSLLLMSEKIKRNISITDTISLTKQEYHKLKKEMKRLKGDEKSGIACFYLSRISDN